LSSGSKRSVRAAFSPWALFVFLGARQEKTQMNGNKQMRRGSITTNEASLLRLQHGEPAGSARFSRFPKDRRKFEAEMSIFNRGTSELEIVLTHRNQMAGKLSNRGSSQVPSSLPDSRLPGFIWPFRRRARKFELDTSISNRLRCRLETAVSYWKQTIGANSNRRYSAYFSNAVFPAFQSIFSAVSAPLASESDAPHVLYSTRGIR
jgi:hypothetical protein